MHSSFLKQHYKLTAGLLIGFIISTAILLADELWESSSQADYDEIEELLKSPQNHVNTGSIQKIISSINDKNSFSFVVLGDNRGNLKMFKKILRSVKDERPDFIIHTGDLTRDGNLSEYTSMMQIIEQYEIPIVFCPGNHDIKNYGTESFLHFMGPLNFFFDMGPYRFIFLDNAGENVDADFAELPKDDAKKYAVSHGIDDYQLQCLEKLLLEKKKSFIVMHLPPPLRGLDFRSFDRESSEFIDLVKKHRDRIIKIFCGHIHGYAESVQDGVQYIITAGAGADLIKSKPGLTGKFNYVLVRVSGDSITHEVKYCD
jgi:3',5'-cyclic AMP phosphodiesterase CpdA